MMADRLRDDAALWRSLENIVEFGEQPSPIDKFLGGIRDFYTLDGITSLTLNMKAFQISAAKRYISGHAVYKKIYRRYSRATSSSVCLRFRRSRLWRFVPPLFSEQKHVISQVGSQKQECFSFWR